MRGVFCLFFCCFRFQNYEYFLQSFTNHTGIKNYNKNLHCVFNFPTLKEFVILLTRHVSLTCSEQVWLARCYLISPLVSSRGWSKEICRNANQYLAFHKLFLCLIHFLINILLSLLFQINSFYVSPQISPFLHSILNSILPEWEGQEGGGTVCVASSLGESQWRHWNGENQSWTMMVLKPVWHKLIDLNKIKSIKTSWLYVLCHTALPSTQY